MNTQWSPTGTRFKYHPTGRVCGVIDVGTIVYLQDSLGRGARIVTRDPWIVMSWLPREYFPATAGCPATTYMAGGHMALVRSLRSGRVARVADHRILACVDAGLERN